MTKKKATPTRAVKATRAKAATATSAARPDDAAPAEAPKPPPESPVAAPRPPFRRPASFNFAGVGRNDICPCGSGKRFKNCHGH